MYQLDWHYLITAPVYDRTDFKYIMHMQGASPSPLLDSSIAVVYSNTTSELGLTT